MRHLYWSCEGKEVDPLLGRLHEFGSKAEFAGSANGLEIIHIPEPDNRILEETPKLTLQKRVRSAALVATALPPERLFIAAEWWYKFVVEISQLAAAERLARWLHRVGDADHFNLAIFDVHDTDERSSDSESDEKVFLGEFPTEPLTEETVLSNPEKHYGRFASTDFGGANALFAAGQEAARMRGLHPGTVLVGAPAAFGFGVDENESSVISWRRKHAIAVYAFGFSLSNWSAAVEQWRSSVETPFDKIAGENQIDQWHKSGIQFGLAIALRGLIDPPIVIPMGSIYQQPVMGSPSQTLATAYAGTYMVGAGATVPLVLPAWCLNPTFSPPHGPMTPTPLMASSASGTQHAVWEGIRRRYGGAR